MRTFWEVVQWAFAASGVGGIAFAACLNGRLNKQKLKLDKLKTKFDYLLIERNKALMALNTRVSDIEMWMRKTSKIEYDQHINIHEFIDLLSKLEVTLIHSRVILPSEPYFALNELLESLTGVLDIYNDECEKLGQEPMDRHPLETFAIKLHEPRVREMINTVKIRIGEELSEDD